MAISPEQRAILIERLKKAQEAKRAKAEARKADAVKAEAKPEPKPKAEPKPKPEPKPKAEPKPAPTPVPIPEPESEEEFEKPELTPVVQEIYHKDKKGTFVEITASPPWGEPEMLEKRSRSKPIDIPPPKPSKDKGYMKLKFYKEPSQKVLKKIMKIHDESSSSEEEEEEAPPAPPPVQKPSQAEAKKAHMKELAKYYFDYY